MTKEERHLWYDFLKTFPGQNRLKIMPDLSLTLIFTCHTAKLVVAPVGCATFSHT
jgi:hypothetical protein